MTVVVLDTRSVPEAAAPAQGGAPPSLKKELVAEAKAASPPALPPAFWEGVPIDIWPEPVEKQATLRHLLDSCLPDARLRDAVWRQLLERESQGGTFLGEDISLPHARIASMEKPLVAIAIARAGIYDPQADRSASIMILLLSPRLPPDAHVAYLGEIGRMARDDRWRRLLLEAGTADQARKAIRQWITASLIEPGNPG
jgi:mannitol/fructose-specific phosphotransferase system IIA component (Ntr-type)